MLRIGKSVSAPGKQYTEDGERIDYTPEEYDRYHEIAGRLTYNELRALVKSPDYADMTDAERRKAAKKALSKARKDARSLIHDPDFNMPARGQEPDVPFTPADAFDPWDDFEDAE